MRVVDDYESLLNELDLLLERAHDSFSNVIDVRIISVSHVFVCKKKLTCYFKFVPWPFCVPSGYLGVSGNSISKSIYLIPLHFPTWKKINLLN